MFRLKNIFNINRITIKESNLDDAIIYKNNRCYLKKGSVVLRGSSIDRLKDRDYNWFATSYIIQVYIKSLEQRNIKPYLIFAIPKFDLQLFPMYNNKTNKYLLEKTNLNNTYYKDYVETIGYRNNKIKIRNTNSFKVKSVLSDSFIGINDNELYRSSEYVKDHKAYFF